MKTILEDNISYDTKIKDFGVDSVNKRIITTGDKLIFLKEGKIEKEGERNVNFFAEASIDIASIIGIGIYYL